MSGPADWLEHKYRRLPQISDELLRLERRYDAASGAERDAIAAEMAVLRGELESLRAHGGDPR